MKVLIQFAFSLVLSALCLISNSIYSQSSTLSKEILSISQEDTQGELFHFQDIKKYKATVLFFLDTECPNCQKYGATLRELYNELTANNILVLGIYPVTGSSAENINAFNEDYQLSFRSFLDPSRKIVQVVGATITPEACLLGKQGEILYQGAINNWFYELGRYRKVITEDYLTDALVSYLNDRPIKVKRTKAIGCFIGADQHDMHHKMKD